MCCVNHHSMMSRLSWSISKWDKKTFCLCQKDVFTYAPTVVQISLSTGYAGYWGWGGDLKSYVGKMWDKTKKSPLESQASKGKKLVERLLLFFLMAIEQISLSIRLFMVRNWILSCLDYTFCRADGQWEVTSIAFSSHLGVNLDANIFVKVCLISSIHLFLSSVFCITATVRRLYSWDEPGVFTTR